MTKFLGISIGRGWGAPKGLRSFCPRKHIAQFECIKPRVLKNYSDSSSLAWLIKGIHPIGRRVHHAEKNATAGLLKLLGLKYAPSVLTGLRVKKTRANIEVLTIALFV